MNMLMAETINPWDQQPDEGTKAFEAFKTYRDLGPKRNHRDAVFKLTGKRNTRARFDLWSAKYSWVARCNAYDRWMDQQVTNKRANDILEMSERHSTMAVIFLNKVVARLQNVDPNTLTPDQLLKWFETAARVERLARGESTENIRTHHTGSVNTKVDLTQLDEDDFDAIHAIITRATNRITGGRGSSEKKEGELITVR